MEGRSSHLVLPFQTELCSKAVTFSQHERQKQSRKTTAIKPCRTQTNETHERSVRQTSKLSPALKSPKEDTNAYLVKSDDFAPSFTIYPNAGQDLGKKILFNKNIVFLVLLVSFVFCECISLVCLYTFLTVVVRVLQTGHIHKTQICTSTNTRNSGK